MKSTLIEAEVKKPEVKFPCMGRNKTIDELIVLFTEPTKGTVIHSNFNTFLWTMGRYCDEWGPVTDNRYWTILPAGTKVELIQE
jgi:hypothetical protein